MIVHRSNRMEALADALADLVARPPPDPFAAEWIVVQGRGMGRWLAMELARRLGIWANPAFPFPRRLIEAAAAAVLGTAGGVGVTAELGATPAPNAFDPETLRWAIAAALPQLLDRVAFAPIRRYLADDPQGNKCLQLAGRVADLFDQYAVYRPEMVLGWERGVDDDWQAVLWRALVGTHGAAHAAAHGEALLAALAAGKIPDARFPRRISLFGLSTLPPLYVRILSGLAKTVELHLFLLTPSRLRSGPGVAPSSAPAAETGAPLLASLGRVGREFADVLSAHAQWREGTDDRFVEPGAATMLAALQSDVLAQRTRVPGGRAAPLALVAGDDSITVHACHGQQRQVEVLLDQLCALFAREASLEPQHVIVMTPAIDAYAPVIDAVFGSPGHPAIPFRIADRRARTQQEVTDAFLRALELLAGRLPAPAVLDLLALDPVRARVAIAADQLDLVRRWVAESGIRWGADAAHRAELGQPPCDDNTWRFGLDRLLLGYALPADGAPLFGGVLPYDDVEGSEAVLLGRFAAFCSTLMRFRTTLREPRHPAAWREVLLALLGGLAANTPANAHQHLAVVAALDALADRAATAGFTGTVDLDTMRTLLEREIESGGSPRGFLTGAVTFCELVPMRTIPFRVVCLLGLDDGAFPRARRALAFDRMAQRPQPGDRTSRDDDRYLFLEALLAARERMIITYAGQSISDNSELPPSVVVNELLDAVDQSFVDPAGGRPRQHIVRRHALQPFSPRYFGAPEEDASSSAPVERTVLRSAPRAGPSDSRPTDDRQGSFQFAPHADRLEESGELFSYARIHFEGARALVGERQATPPFLTAPLPAEAIDTVAVEDLVRFFANPSRWFLQRRLGVYLGNDAELLDDREPVELDALEIWRLGDGLLQGALRGVEPSDAWPALRAGGTLPLGVPGRCVFDDVAREAGPLIDTVRGARGGERLPVEEIDVTVDGVRVIGALRELWPGGQVAVHYARLPKRHELALWIRHLARNAAQAPRGESVLVGRVAKGTGAVAVWFGPVAEPLQRLGELVRLFRLGQCVPLPFFRYASRAFAEALLGGAGDQALEGARKAFTGGAFDRDTGDPYVAELYRGVPPFGADGAALPSDVSFADAARIVFEPLLRHRQERV